MRLFISLFKYFPYGGLQKDTLRFALEACRRGHEVTLFTTQWDGERPSTASLHIEIAPQLHAWSNTARMDEFGTLALQRLAAGEFDVSLAMNRLPGHDFYFAADSCMKRYLPQKHSWLWRLLSPRCHAILRQEAAIFARSSKTKILYIAEAQRAEFSAEYATPQERLIALPPGMDAACLPPSSVDECEAVRVRCRRELSLAPEDKLLLIAGNSFFRKGMDRLLAAVAILPEALRAQVKCCLVGGYDVTTAQKSVAKLGLHDSSVIFLAARPNIGELLQAADLMVHPAREEGTGTVLVEAIASHLPVICTAVCGFSPYVAASGGCVIAEPFTDAVLKDAIVASLANLAELRKDVSAYAQTQDFCARSRVAIDILEAAACQR